MTEGPDSIITSLAILNVNWNDDHRNDYMQPFSEMLAEVVLICGENILTVDRLQTEYERKFGLKLPAGVIKSLLRRLERNKYVIRKESTYRPDKERLRRRNFGSVRETVLEEYDLLIEKFVAYCLSSFDTVISHSDAEEYIEGFLAEHQFVLLNAFISNKAPILPLQASQSPTHKYLTGRFISEIARNRTREFKYLERVLKGMMLVNVLYLPDNRSIKKKWTTAFYFDTPFLIESLGYQGIITRDLRVELITALRATGAKVRCFRHNVDEVRNILYACLNILESGNLSKAYGPMVSSIDFMLEEGFTPADLKFALTTVEEDLGRLGIDVFDKPEFLQDYVVDEARFESLLLDTYSSNGRADKEKQRINDIDSVASVFRLRKGKPYAKIEECKAVFVTHNVALLKASHKMFREREHEVTHCLTDFTVSNLLWLLRPDNLPDMPRKQIIADAYAATQPDSALWRKYVDKIENLKRRSEIEADDYYAFRYTQEARNSLMEITHGSREVLTDGTVREILEVVKSKFQKEQLDRASVQQAALQREADLRTTALSKLLEDSQQEKQRVIQEQQRVVQNRRNRAQLWARRVFRIGRFLILSINILFFMASSPIHILSIDLNKGALTVQIILGIVWILLYIAILLEMRDGRNLRVRIDDAESRIARWIERKLTHITE